MTVTGRGMNLGLRLAFGGLALLMAHAAGAQENLDHGKTPVQMFASDCAICHKSPQGLAKSGGLFGIEGFLRQHYTASRESAAALANYLRAVGDGPAGGAKKGTTTTKRAAKGDEKGKAGQKKSDAPVVLPGDNKPADAKPSEPAAAEAKPAEAKPAESKPAESKPAEPAPAPKAD